jgi:hypothetical protein
MNASPSASLTRILSVRKTFPIQMRRVKVVTRTFLIKKKKGKRVKTEDKTEKDPEEKK